LNILDYILLNFHKVNVYKIYYRIELNMKENLSIKANINNHPSY